MFEVQKVVKNRVVAEKRQLCLKEESCGLKMKEFWLKNRVVMKKRVEIERRELWSIIERVVVEKTELWSKKIAVVEKGKFWLKKDNCR